MYAVLCTGSYAFPAATPIAGDVDVYSLSLKELIELNVSTGSLFEYSGKESPAGVTIISREKIEVSSAKNLAHLLEQHVPGMLLMSHSEGDKIGLRGQIAAENYKLLLLINGKNITNYVYEGVITEIDQWELGDIERIEVVSGPGSVTYGTGAIAGVINIITKTAKDNLPSFSVGLPKNYTYRSSGINLQYSDTFKELGVFAFLSFRETDGLDSPDYYSQKPIEATDIRYIGKGVTANAEPQDYLADSFGRPQVKAHIGLNYGDNFSSWLRYTQSGQTHSFREKAYRTDGLGNPLKAVNGRNLETSSLALSAEYKVQISDKASLTSSLTLDSQEYIRYGFKNPQFNEDSTNNILDYAFSQDRVAGTFLYDYRYSDALKAVIGYEYSAIKVGAPWGEGGDHLWINEGDHIINDADSSVYLQDLSLNGRPPQDKLIEVGSSLTFETHSHLLETHYKLSDSQNIIYAHRLDYPDISKTMFSPRLSLVSKIDQDNTVVSTIQRAQRMMPLRAQYLSDRNGDNSKHETLDSVEVSYTTTRFNNTAIDVRAYYNDLSAVGFTGENLEFLSDVELFGLELSATYKKNNIEITANHSYLNPLDVKMNDDLKTGSARNNISYADYFYYTSSSVPVLLEGYGDSLNNWPTNITKLLFTQSFMNNRLKLHLDAQIYWEFDGSYDEARMYQEAYDNFDTSSLSALELAVFEQDKVEFERERELLDDEDAFELDYNLNASVSYLWSVNKNTDISIKLYAENILNSSRRYNVSTGSRRYYPERLEFLENPEVYGLSLQINYK